MNSFAWPIILIILISNILSIFYYCRLVKCLWFEKNNVYPAIYLFDKISLLVVYVSATVSVIFFYFMPSFVSFITNLSVGIMFPFIINIGF